MTVLHVVYSFPPDPPGGTEVYVDELCRALSDRAIRCVVAAPGRRDEQYDLGGVEVRRFRTDAERQSLETLYGAGDPVATAAFERVLDDVAPDLVHQHAISPACSGELIGVAKRRRLPVVLTYHSPAMSCQRGSLVRTGHVVCDGLLDTAPCTRCVLEGLGVPRLASRALASVPELCGRTLGRAGLAGGLWTALRMTALVATRRRSAGAWLKAVDRVVAPAGWVERLLEGNGVAATRIVRAPHGLPASAFAHGKARMREVRPLRLVHLGRTDRSKGTTLLIDAVRRLGASADLRLDLYLTVQGGASSDYLREIEARCRGDARVRVRPALSRGEVAAILAEADAVVVPSQVSETGPLVVLEAFAAGTPVIGSAIGGIAEKVQHERSGLLVEPFYDEAAWAAALRRCLDEPELLGQLQQGVPRPPPTAAVAQQMEQVYLDLVQAGSRP